MTSTPMMDKNNKESKEHNGPKRFTRGMTKGGKGVLNPFLDTEGSFNSIKIADKSFETNSLSFGSDASTQTNLSRQKKRCSIM